MTLKIVKWPLVFFILLGALFLGIWIGFQKGVAYGGALEGASFAALSTAQIHRLKAGDQKGVDEVISFLEWYVDHGLNHYYWYSEHGNEYWGKLISADYEEDIKKATRYAAAYRATNPEDEIIKKVDLEGYELRKSVVKSFSK